MPRLDTTRRDAAIVRLREQHPNESLSRLRERLVREDESWAVSVGQISKILTARGERSRAPRSDAGRARARVLSEQQLAMVVALVTGLAGRACQRDATAAIDAPGKTVTVAKVPVETALRELEHRGLIPQGVKPSWVYARLKERNIALRGASAERNGPSVVRRFNARRAGARFQFDGTPLGSFYVDASGDFTYLPDTDKKAAAKASDKARAHVLAWVDDHSRCCRLSLYDGETARNVIESAREVFCRSDDPQRPLSGIPTVVYADNGSGLNSALARRMLRAFGVTLVTHRPRAAWGKGKVEALFRRTNGYQELMRGHRPRSFVEARELLRSIEVELNNSPMEALAGATPIEAWMASAQEQLARGEWRFAAPDESLWRELRLTRYDGVRVQREGCCLQIAGERIALPLVRPYIDWIGQRVSVLLDTPAGQRAATGESVVVLAPSGRERYELPRVPPEIHASLTSLSVPVTAADELAAAARIQAHAIAEHDRATGARPGEWIGSKGRRATLAPGGVIVRPDLAEPDADNGGGGGARVVETVDAHAVKRALLEVGLLHGSDLFDRVMAGRDRVSRRELDHALETGEALEQREEAA
ncbi:MAG: transposase family protein [Phycisphaeraceae bacterium]|nr:transposase family protein [Phycisphaeraceae bacterium]